MSNQPLQNIFDSVCRCFGTIPGHVNANFGIHPNDSVVEDESNQKNEISKTSDKEAGNQPAVEASHSEVGKRRTNRLGLKDQQWDELFGDNNKMGSARRPPKKAGVVLSDQCGDIVTDLGTAHAIAQAKLAANPPRYGGPGGSRSKRKRSRKTKEDIFRSKDGSNKPPANGRYQSTTGPTPFTRLIHPSLAMCFATPVRGTEEEAEEADMRSVDNSDANTLNTCEDTVTSTVYYESKLAHMKETRPPMPLFNQFKIGPSKDEIHNIVANDTHSSVNLIHLMQMKKEGKNGDQGRVSDISSNTQIVVDASPKGSSTRRHNSPATTSLSRGIHHGKGEVPMDEEMEDAVPGVKAVSDSSGSDASMQQHQQQHKVQEMEDADRRKVFLA